jgi:hypothetical protein
MFMLPKWLEGLFLVFIIGFIIVRLTIYLEEVKDF